MFRIQCECGEVYHANDGHVGRSIRCRKCGHILAIGSMPSTNVESKSIHEKEKQKTYASIIKTFMNRKKVIVCAAAIIGILLIFLLILNSIHSPSSSGTGGRNSANFVDDLNLAKVKPDIQKPSLPSAHTTPTKRFEVPIESEPANPKRLRTGTAPYAGGIRSGHSEITVENGTDTDAVVRVVRLQNGTDQKVRNFYVRANDQSVAKRIPPGEYVLRVAFGRDWNVETRKFNFRRSFSETQTFTIEETTLTESKDDGDEVIRTRTSKLSITLHKVPHGNFKSHSIDEDEFWQ